MRTIDEYQKLKSKKEYKEALACLLELYEQGFNVAYELGLMYGFTDGTITDHEKAYHYLSEACGQNEPEAFNMIGYYLEQEAKAHGDIGIAASNYATGISLGSHSAKMNLEKFIDQVITDIPAEQKSNIIGNYLCSVAMIYHYGQDDVAPSIKQAVNLYLASAEYNTLEAFINLSYIYLTDEEVGVDYLKSLEYALKGAELGDGICMNNVGWIYHNGFGVDKDLKKAYEWYVKAADAGSHEGMYMLGTFYEKGIFVKEDLLKAKQWYKKASKKGNEKAKKMLESF